MDVKTNFLHGDLEEEIWMKQLEGFVVKGKKELVWKLKIFLYGLRNHQGCGTKILTHTSLVWDLSEARLITVYIPR
jgi:hypothetical protein